MGKKKSLKYILLKFNYKYINFVNWLFYNIEGRELYQKVRNNNSLNSIYLFSNPTHSNLGDHAQTLTILQWFKSNYPTYEIICVPKKVANKKTLHLIRKKIKHADLLFIHSGYLLFDPHPELPYICGIVKLFNDKKITILPQTINLCDQEVLNMVLDAFNNHSDLTIMCRDEVSLSNGQNLFPNSRLILWPDFVTSLIGMKSFESKRNGVLFCLRNDREKFYSDSEVAQLKSKFQGVYSRTFDTTILKDAYVWKYKREDLIDKVLEKFSKYQLVITDRYHGTIFSQITSTPVIVLSSIDHKLSSGVKWFPKDSFGKNVFFAKSINEAYEIGAEILKREGKLIKNPSYFNDFYFSKLKSLLEDDKFIFK